MTSTRTACLAVLAALCLSAGGYSDPDVNKIICRTPTHQCPSGYVCRGVEAGAGRCCKPEDLNCPFAVLDGASGATPSDVGQQSSTEAGASEAATGVDMAITPTLPDGAADRIQSGQDTPFPLFDSGPDMSGPDMLLPLVDSGPDIQLVLNDGAMDLPR